MRVLSFSTETRPLTETCRTQVYKLAYASNRVTTETMDENYKLISFSLKLKGNSAVTTVGTKS